jgi:hypothetical protein
MKLRAHSALAREIATYKELDAWLQAILQSSRFI